MKHGAIGELKKSNMKSGPSVMLLECTIYLTKSNRWKSKDNQNV